MKTFFAFVLLVAIPAVAFGRIRPVWTYEQMLDKADLVIISRPASSTQTEEKISLPNLSPATRVVGVDTKLDIRLVIKGERKTKQASLHHYALQYAADGQVRGAPELAAFDAKQRSCYLMFLKREADGRYTPVTGQTDPAADCIIKLTGDAQ